MLGPGSTGSTGRGDNLANYQVQQGLSISLRESIQMEKSKAEAELQRTSELLELLDRNPELARAIELLGRRQY
jgi:hypothetical protein